MTRLPRLSACIVFALLAFGLVTACARVAFADDGLDLARVGVHESGPRVTADELAAFWLVATRIPGRRHPLQSQCRLLFSGQSPRAAEAMRVRRGSPRWSALLAVADAVVAGTITHRCAEPGVAHWGGRMDRARARRQGFIRVDCGDTRNDFYRGRR